MNSEDRCVTVFERRAKGARYVLRRWRCPRKKLKGSMYCSYCESPSDKEHRQKERAK